jgi:hypothetical protein
MRMEGTVCQRWQWKEELYANNNTTISKGTTCTDDEEDKTTILCQGRSEDSPTHPHEKEDTQRCTTSNKPRNCWQVYGWRAISIMSEKYEDGRRRVQ